MGITPRSVHDECAGVLADCLGESFRPMLNDDVPPTTFAGETGVEGGAIGVVAVLERGDDDLVLETRFALHNKVMRTSRDNRQGEGNLRSGP